MLHSQALLDIVSDNNLEQMFDFPTGKDKSQSSRKVGSESPCRVELPSADLHSLFFQIHPRWRFFINIFYLKSSHRLFTLYLIHKNVVRFVIYIVYIISYTTFLST